MDLLKEFMFLPVAIFDSYWNLVRRVSLWQKWIFGLVYPLVIEWIIWFPLYNLLHYTVGDFMPFFSDSKVPFLLYLVKVDIPTPGQIHWGLWGFFMIVGLGLIITSLANLSPTQFEAVDEKPFKVRYWDLFHAGLWITFITSWFPTYWAL